VCAAIDRMSAPTSIGSALAVQVNQLSTTEDAWLVSMAPLSKLQPPAGGTAGAGPNPLAMLSKVQQLSGGVKFGANAVLSLQAVSQTDQDAAALATLLKALPAMAQMAGLNGEMASAAALLQNLNVTVDGAVTKISLSIPESQIEQMLQTAHANETHSQVAPQPKTEPAPPSSPAIGPLSVDAAPQRIRIAGTIQKVKLLQQPAPVYPPLAVQARISGVVRLNAILAADGTVKNLTVASGHPLLVPAALEAAKQWVYEPTLLNGKPVEVITQIEVNFALEQ
jgi:TonB family protein